MEMLPIIADTSFNKLAIIDDYISFIWTSRFYTPGDFELCVPVKYADIIKPDFYVYRADDDNVGIIEQIQIQNTEEGQEMIIASGQFLSSILGRRIVAVQTQFVNKYTTEIATGLITQNIINPTIQARQIPNFTIGTFDRMGAQISTQYTGTNVLEAITDLCKTNNLGFKITEEGGDFVFMMYEGKDRTYQQSENPFVVFSEEYDNLFSSTYEENHAGIINAVLVAGEGEGLSRKTVWVPEDSTISGLELRELYKDQRNVQSNDGEISPEEYMAQLASKGEDSLTNYTASFSGNVSFDGVQYKTDVNLGDLCVIENNRWNLHIYGRLLEVTESTDEAGAYSISPTFGFT